MKINKEKYQDFLHFIHKNSILNTMSYSNWLPKFVHQVYFYNKLEQWVSTWNDQMVQLCTIKNTNIFKCNSDYYDLQDFNVVFYYMAKYRTGSTLDELNEEIDKYRIHIKYKRFENIW
jgi:hypothetical protein